MIDWIFTQLGVPQNLHAQPWHIVFERNPPPWLCFVILITLVGASVFSYAKIRAGKLFRKNLATRDFRLNRRARGNTRQRIVGEKL